MLWLLCFGLGVGLWFHSCAGELFLLGRSGIHTLFSLVLTLFCASLNDLRGLLRTQRVCVPRETERKPLTFQTKTKPVRVTVNLKYCQNFNCIWHLRMT